MDRSDRLIKAGFAWVGAETGAFATTIPAHPRLGPYRGDFSMSDPTLDQRTVELRRMAIEAEIAAEMSVDPNGKLALRAVAFKYRRLADFRAWIASLEHSAA